MSSLNKAFIQVYKKSDRPIAKEASGGPHFSVESIQAPVVATAATVKPVVPMPESAQVAPAIANSEATYVRIDRSEDLASALQPWLTSISTIGIDGYISTSKRKNDEAVEPPRGEEPQAPQTRQERGVVETTVAVEFPSKEEAPQVQFFRTDVAHLEPKGSGASSVAYHGRMPSRPILGTRSSTLARAMPSAAEPVPTEDTASPSIALPGIEEQSAPQEDRTPTRRSEHAWEKCILSPLPQPSQYPIQPFLRWKKGLSRESFSLRESRLRGESCTIGTMAASRLSPSTKGGNNGLASSFIG